MRQREGRSRRWAKEGQRLILVTAHRRENFGQPLVSICRALSEIALCYGSRVQLVYPVHPNPNVLGPVHEMLGGIPNITLTEPLGYYDFVRLMSEAHLILTDSGGLQEEAPSMGIPVLVLRQAIEQIGGLDEGIFMYAEEVDWCYRLVQAGWKVMYLPHVKIIHYGGQSSRKRQGRMEAELYRSRVYLFRKHYGRVPAFALKVLICAITLPKILIHGALRVITGGRRGRTVTSWQELQRAMSSIDAKSRRE